MDEENGPLPASIPNPKMVNRFVSMKHKFETAKLRDLLREVNGTYSIICEFYLFVIRRNFYFCVAINIFRNAEYASRRIVRKNLTFVEIF